MGLTGKRHRKAIGLAVSLRILNWFGYSSSTAIMVAESSL